MRKYSILLLTGLVVLATSCKKYLDVNTSPNSPATSTPELVLPAALATTASLNVSFSNYGSALGGGYANAGGFSGFGAGFMNYNYSTGDYAGLWSSTYDNCTDYQYILDNTTPNGNYKNYNAVARVMKAYSFLRLVDVYGDVPYSQALKGANNITPAYDKAEDVYKACITEINTAIASMRLPNPNTVVKLSSSTATSSSRIDIFGTLNGGAFTPLSAASGLDMTNWIKFANNIKLRALIHIQKVTSLASTYTTEMSTLATDASGFLTTDVVAQPGYINQAGKINPTWASWGYGTTGTLLATSSEPTTFAVAFYNNTKISDPVRGPLMYRNYTVNNQLGFQVNPPAVPNPGGIFFQAQTTAVTGTGASFLGFNKGYTMAQPIMLGAETYLLIAEANLIGKLGTVADAQTNFDLGILASINYLELTEAGTLGAGKTPGTVTGSGTTAVYTGDLKAYKDANPSTLENSFLVQFHTKYVAATSSTRATTAAEQLEAIITQKWIALNMITSNESWSDYKRTTYPKTVPGGAAALDMASTQSLSTRADRLPGRILYPASEFSYNPSNVKKVNPYTDVIFFDIAATGGTR